MTYREQAEALVKEMTLEEKASFCSGSDFWHLKALDRLGLASVMVTDGPHGLRKQAAEADNLGLNDSVPATCFPTASLTACSFDRELLGEIGRAIGEECRQEDVAVVLGPGVNIKRDPRCGRNFEYFSEDPLLAGELAAAFINGVQSQGVGTSLKHFAANNQEKLRMTSESVIDDRALMELYLTAFEIAVKKARPWTVMCSYNKLRGEYASENRWLLTDVLRGEWGFDGLTVSDWGAVNDRVRGVAAGLDLEMPAVSPDSDAAVAAAVGSGALAGGDLDETATRVTELLLKARERQPFTYDAAAHHALARRAAASSAVLLKNEDGILPLKAGRTLAVIGAMAEKPRYQGAGSSKINPNRIDSAVDELRAAGFTVEYAPGYDLETDAPDEALTEAACAAAAAADTAVIFAGLPDRYESEGFDRRSLAMPENHTRLIERVAAANPRTVVVLQTGGVTECPWEPAARAILLQYLGGEASCGATADLLTGRVSPSGKLAESWCFAGEDAPAAKWFARQSRTAEYRESVYVGYRYYDTAGVAVRWPFGYGLSYTRFEYSDISLDRTAMTDGETLSVSFAVTNAGGRDGAEAVQLYVEPRVGGIFRPTKELKGFDKVLLAPGETKHVTLALDGRAFAYYNTEAGRWAVESGEYGILVGSSSRDIRLSAAVTVTAEQPVAAPDHRADAPCYYDIKAGLDVTDGEFEALTGRPLPPTEMQKGEPFTVNSTLGEIRRNLLGRMISSTIRDSATEMVGDDPDMKLMLEAMLYDAPLRMLLMAGGGMTPKRLNGIVDMLNGHILRGIKATRG